MMTASSCGEDRGRQGSQSSRLIADTVRFCSHAGSGCLFLSPSAIVWSHRTPQSASPPSPSLCACFLLEDTHPVAMVSVVITSMDLIHSIYSKSLAWSILRLSSPSQGLEERPRDMEDQSNWSFCNNQHPHLPLGRSKAGRIYSS